MRDLKVAPGYAFAVSVEGDFEPPKLHVNPER